MTTLITGGSKCGKSRYAEHILGSSQRRRIYIATMQPYGKEAQEAIARHRRMRVGKGFETVECYTDIEALELPEDCAVLLECLGNLCANEMFRSGVASDPTAQIIFGLSRLAERSSELVIVTNQVGSDGISYSEGTAAYISALGRINAQAAQLADCVIECVYGIPVALKGALPC